MAKSKKPKRQKLNPKRYFHFTLGLALVLAGSSLLIYSSVNKISPPPPQVQQINPNIEGKKPAKIYIPKLSRNLNVSDGYLVENRWIISQTGVSFYTDSALPQEGNTVIYGHNTKDVLGSLWRLKNGDFIYIVAKNGKIAKYEVFETKEIKPDQVEILNKTEDSRLTLYTCSGFLDRARFVVLAKPVNF